MENHEEFCCSNCGSHSYVELNNNTVECEYCKTKYKIKKKTPQAKVQIGDFKASVDLGDTPEKVRTFVEKKSATGYRYLYAFLTLVFGFMGLEYFLMGRIGKFVVCIIFMFTGVPFFIGIIKAIVALFTSNEAFEAKVRRAPNCWLYRKLQLQPLTTQNN